MDGAFLSSHYGNTNTDPPQESDAGYFWSVQGQGLILKQVAKFKICNI